jgi:NAD(P)-dependent dehydrogenase (short-subunit alcohol dehydrogenase family)
MDVMLTRCLAALNKEGSVTFNSLHPGVIDTKLLRAGFKVQGDSVEVGCETSVFLATADEVRGVTGKYFVSKKEAMISVGAQNDKVVTDLYRKTQSLLKPWL